MRHYVCNLVTSALNLPEQLDNIKQSLSSNISRQKIFQPLFVFKYSVCSFFTFLLHFNHRTVNLLILCEHVSPPAYLNIADSACVLAPYNRKLHSQRTGSLWFLHFSRHLSCSVKLNYTIRVPKLGDLRMKQVSDWNQCHNSFTCWFYHAMAAIRDGKNYYVCI